MQKRILSELPLAKVILPFMAGILIFSFCEIEQTPALFLFYSCFVLLLVLSFLRTGYAPVISSMLLVGMIVLGSGIRTDARALKNQKDHYSKKSATFLIGYIESRPEEKEKSYKTVIVVDSLIDSQMLAYPASGKLLVYFEKDSTLLSLNIGDKILIPANYKPVDPPKNPGQFDYRKFLANKYIYHQAYIRSEQVVCVSQEKKFAVKRVSRSIAAYVQNILRSYIPGEENFALADGILLGHRSEIDEEVYNAFAFTGILHILSVSGLHVGIVYALLAFILGLVPDFHPRIRIVKFIFICAFIWLFAFVTGLGAAVVRAAILFTLLNYGRIKNEHTNPINLLCGAALIQLLLDPGQLFDIGFQLSYLAMLGIFLLYKRIYSVYYSRYKILDWIWQLWALSLAAQVFTLPLSIYYFGNFPLYFLIANIFAIPLSTLILWLSIALIPLSLIPVLAVWLGKLIAFLVAGFIGMTLYLAELPGGKINGLYLNGWQTALVFLSVILFSFFLIRTHYRSLLAALVLILITICSSVYDTIQAWNRDEIVLYSVPKQTVLAYNQRDIQTLISFDTIPKKQFNFLIKNSQRRYSISECRQLIVTDSMDLPGIQVRGSLLLIDNKSFYFINKQNNRLSFKDTLRVDYLVLSDNMYLNMEYLCRNFKYKELILASDNDARHIRIYRKLLDAEDLPYSDMADRAKVIPL